MSSVLSASQPVLLFGASGQLGTEFIRSFADANVPLVIASSQRNTTWRYVDICDRTQLLALISEIKPALVINASAYTAVDLAEDEQSLANTVNATAPQVMAEACTSHDATLIHFSTDYVFDGKQRQRAYTEDDAANPLNAYGRSKLQGERLVLAQHAAHYVFRTSWLYRPGGRNFVSTMLRLFHSQPSVSVVDDQRGSPTNAADLARAIVQWLSHTSSEQLHAQAGLYHLCSQGQCSWFEFAQAIHQRATPSAKAQLQAIDTATFAARAARPASSVLDCAKAAQRLKLQLPHWLDALEHAMPAFNKAASAN